MAGPIGYPAGRGGPVPQFPNQGTDSFGRFLHWIWYGPTEGGHMGLDSVPGQVLSAFDPRSRAGLANLASMFAGGEGGSAEGGMGGRFDASPQMDSLGMRGQFEEYSPTKATLGGKLGSTHEGQPHQINYSIRASNKGVPPGRYGDWAKFLHDSLFGGEAHLKGPVPSSRSPYEFSRRAEQEQALNDMQRLHEHLAQANARDPQGHEFDAAAEQIARERQARQRAKAEMFHAHGISEHLSTRPGPEHSPESQPDVRVGTKGAPFHQHDPAVQKLVMKALLQRRYQAQAGHNHMN